MTYRTAAETAREIRRALKQCFPGVKFSVRSSTGAVNVRWTDGPTQAAVDAVVQRFAQVRRDHEGEILCGGNLFVFTTRETSPELQARVMDRLTKYYGRTLNLNVWDDYVLYLQALNETTGDMPKARAKTRTTRTADSPATVQATFWMVGVWSWLSFPEQPPEDVLDALKRDGWRWSRKRNAWFHLDGKRPPACVSYHERTE